MNRIRVPKYAVKNARRGLDQRKQYSESKRPVLSVKEANEKDIHSGVTSARTLIANDHISLKMAERIYDYLNRNQADTERSLVARRVWGGEKSQRFQEYLKRKLPSR